MVRRGLVQPAPGQHCEAIQVLIVLLPSVPGGSFILKV